MSNETVVVEKSVKISTYLRDSLNLESNQHAENTKKTYKSKMKGLFEWLKTHNNGENAQYIDSMEKITTELLFEYLGYYMRKKDGTYKSYSSANGFYSALKLYFETEKKVNIDPSLFERLRKYAHGLKRTKCSLKQQGIEKNSLGKSHFTFDAFRNIAALSLKHSTFTQEYLVHHTNIVLDWNLFARNSSACETTYQQVAMQEDSISIAWDVTKTKQDGDKRQVRHLYANPFDPIICCFLSLGVKFVSSNNQHYHHNSSSTTTATTTTTTSLPSSVRVLDVDENSFGKWLKKRLSKLSNEEQASLLGGVAGQYGTHSFRKGAVTYVSTNPGGPPVVSAFQRADWTLGEVPNRYIFENEGKYLNNNNNK